MATNKYTVNGGPAIPIYGGGADIDMSTESGVKAGCLEYPIPLLNKIIVTSTEGAFSKSTAIYAGYKVVNQLLGSIVPAGNYNLNTPLLSTIISNGRFGMFEPAHYNSATSWNTHNMREDQIDSLINVGTGVKICVKIEYTKTNSSRAEAYVPIDRASNYFSQIRNRDVPLYSQIGQSALTSAETVRSQFIDSPSNRTWFESVLTSDILDINLSTHITDPDTSQNITVTLMAYIGSTPTADNTFPILRDNMLSSTSITCQFETYEPTISIINRDMVNNPDMYQDGYGSVAEYDTASTHDTTISINIYEP